jgi:ElaB/YqjD/DUF883 family membrane-anchored ribosome-binding protein
MANNTPASFRNVLADESATLADKFSDSATQLKDRVSEFGRKAADTIDEGLGSAASGLDKAAAALHERADYVRDHKVDKVVTNFRTLVKNNPGPSLIAAGVLGFLVGRSFRSCKTD